MFKHELLYRKGCLVTILVNSVELKEIQIYRKKTNNAISFSLNEICHKV